MLGLKMLFIYLFVKNKIKNVPANSRSEHGIKREALASSGNRRGNVGSE